MPEWQITAEPGSHAIVITREFNAPRELVFRAFTDPDLVVQWLGPREMTMRIDRYEVRDGGVWRYVHTDPDGNEFGFRGVQHGEATPDRMVRTFEFEGMPGHVSLETMTLEDRGEKTFMRQVVVFQSVEDRDGVVAAGMERGMRESLEKLDELLARLSVRAGR